MELQGSGQKQILRLRLSMTSKRIIPSVGHPEKAKDLLLSLVKSETSSKKHGMS